MGGSPTLSCQLSRGNGEPKFRILSANISTWGPQAEGFLRSAEVGRFQRVALAEHHSGANRISKLDKLRKQPGGTVGTAETLTKGTSRGTSTATRNHVALAAWIGEVGRAWALSFRLECTVGDTERLHGVTRHGVHDGWGWLSRAKTCEKCGSSSTSSGAVSCRSSAWETGIRLQKKCRKTELVGSSGAVIKTPLAWRSLAPVGNRLLDYALVDQRLESVVMLNRSGQSRGSRMSLRKSASHGAPHTHTKENRGASRGTLHTKN